MAKDMVGQEVRKYRLLGKLGEGSFGSVYLGEHIDDKTQVAIKILKAQLNVEELKEFINEVSTNVRLKHPHIVRLLDFGISEQDSPFLVLEYAPNKSLLDRLQRQPSHPLPMGEAITILSQIGQALQYAHSQDIVHRDLKPANILFNAKSDALLADFGIAVILEKTTRAQSAGTLAYMAPEQFEDIISKKSDQYALGCIAYELFTGRRPFVAKGFAAMAWNHVNIQPAPLRQLNLSLPEYVEQAVLKAMAKNRDDRFSDISSFIAALNTPPQPKIPEQNAVLPVDVVIPSQLPKTHIQIIDKVDVLNRVRGNNIPSSWQVIHPAPTAVKKSNRLTKFFMGFLGVCGASIILVGILHMAGIIYQAPNNPPDWFVILSGIFVLAISILPLPYALDKTASMLVLLPQGCVQLTYKRIYSVIRYQEIEAAYVYKERLRVKFPNKKKEATPIDLIYFESPQTIAQTIVDAYTSFRDTPK